tara:strand:- start:43 stop:990 length:948 start_codon:yes stop_codon:yes gene_type:complete
MDLQYLKFEGFNLATQTGLKSFPIPSEYEELAGGACYPVIENTRTLKIDKDDIDTIFGYEPVIYTVNGSNFGTLLSYRVVLDLANKGMIEAQIVSEVPVNKLDATNSKETTPVLVAQDSGLRALACPFQAFASKDYQSTGVNTFVSPCDCGTLGEYLDGLGKSGTGLPTINGKQYQWTEEAILAYFGIFTTQTGSPAAGPQVSVRQTVLNWLEEKVSKYLVSNPGTPTTNVELGEVKDFTYKGVTYGGFKLRFGAIGTYCPVNVYNPDPATSGSVPLVWGWCSDTNSGGECTNSAVTWNVPFRYNDQHVDVVDPS